MWDHKPPLIYYVDALGLAMTPGELDGVCALEVAAIWTAAVLLFAAATLVISVPGSSWRAACSRT